MTTSTDNEDRQQIRSLYDLRELTQDEEGTSIDRLPGGIYGYTYSPAADNFPLFREKKVRCYEAHKRRDGGSYLVGYLTAEEAEQVKDRQRRAVIHLFAEPQGSADRLVLVPMARVARHKEYSQREGNGLELTLGP